VPVVEAAESEHEHLQDHRRDVPGQDDQPPGPGDPPARVGKEDVQPDRRQQQVAQLADGVEHRLVRPLQCGHRSDQPGGDQQPAEPAVRPAPPGDHAGDDERHGRPAEQQQPQLALVDLLAAVRQGDRGGAGRHGREAEGDERNGAGRRAGTCSRNEPPAGHAGLLPAGTGADQHGSVPC
jgi:hypothetical protein